MPITSGTVIANIPAGVATSIATGIGNAASTSTDNVVTWIDCLPPTIIFEDDFNRVDSSSLGPDWTDTSLWTIFSNFAYFPGGTGDPQFERALTTMGGPDHWVEGIVVPPTAVNPWISAICGRVTTGSTYYAWKDASTNTIKLTAGGTEIGSAADGFGAAADGAQLRLELEGTNLRVYHYYSATWHLLIDVTDSTYTTGDYVGILGYRLTGGSIVEDFKSGIGWLSCE